MKPSLQLRFSQQLTMTPQLQQAIRLLQLSTLELQQEIQEALESNPLLESTEDGDSDYSSEQESSKDADSDNLDLNDPDKNLDSDNYADNETKNSQDNLDDFDDWQQSGDSSTVESTDAMTKEQMPDELPVDSDWEDTYSNAPASVSAPSKGVDLGEDYTYQGETTDSIQDHLLWQMELTPFSETDRTIAITIIEGIDDSGYLTVSAEDVLESLGNEEIELDEVEAVLKRIQLFDPVGVAARSAQECLMVQLTQFDKNTPWLQQTKDVITNHMDLLANRDYRTLSRKTKLKEEQLREVMRLIHSLDPRPGNAIVKDDSQYVVPDVSVSKKNGRWVVELNPDCAPKIRVNETYAAMSRNAKSANDSQFIRSHLQEAKWFIKSLESRNDTLLKVSNCIVQQQQAFFEYGEEAMKPMILNDVAEMVDMHESTISRVTTQKYMHTPRGIFELKYFFSSHVSTENGGECSSTAIRALIKKLVAAETPAKPLSDSKMAELLAEQGINVARRTIAKYRESLSIPPSNQRKSLL